MRALLRLSFPITLAAALGACAQIIGVSDLELDSSLDGGGSSGSGGTSGRAGEAGAPQGGEPTEPTGGSAGASGGEGGGAGSTSGCRRAADCDDEIACTTDVCLPSGECQHTADDTACIAAAGKCTSCQAGIGCVDSEPVEKDLELLLDASFDEQSEDWQDFSSGNVTPVAADAAAQSGTHAVHFLPAADDATKTRFFNLSQLVHIPAGTVKLTASGWYKMLWAATELEARPRTDEYATLTLFSLEDEDGKFTRYYDYNSWDGEDAPQTTWKAFTFDAPRSALRKVQDLDITLDLVAETWDTQFYFDTLSLKAAVCQ
jgi:hypothetical protein